MARLELIVDVTLYRVNFLSERIDTYLVLIAGHLSVARNQSDPIIVERFNALDKIGTVGEPRIEEVIDGDSSKIILRFMVFNLFSVEGGYAVLSSE